MEIKDKIPEIRTKTLITSRQCRGARGLLGLSQRELAAASGVHLQTLLDFEKGHRVPRGPTMQAIVRALEDAGVVFIPANGGGYETPADMVPWASVSIVGAVTGQKFTARRW